MHRPIEVQSWQHCDPAVFRDRELTYEICFVIDKWKETGEWWSGEGVRRVLRVMTQDASLFDLECINQSWFIYKVWD